MVTLNHINPISFPEGSLDDQVITFEKSKLMTKNETSIVARYPYFEKGRK